MCFVLSLLFTALVLLLPASVPVDTVGAPVSWYVSPTGSDANPCTVSMPCLTLDRAVSLAEPGNMIYARGGLYEVTSAQRIQTIGASGSPVMITAFPGEVPRFSGARLNLSQYDSLVKIVDSKYVTFDGFEVCCSNGRGISVSNSQFITISHNIVTEIADRAIGGHGDEITVSYNIVDHVVLNHADLSGSSGWSAAVSSYSYQDGRPSRNWTFVGNTITRSYGECMIALRIIGFVVRDNLMDGCFSVNLYIDKGRNGLVTGNTLRASIPGFERPPWGRSAHGILVGAEESSSVKIAPGNITFNRNIIGPGNWNGFVWWADPANNESWNTYDSLVISNNRIIGTTDHAAYFPAVGPGGSSPCCSRFTSNIITGEMYFADSYAWTEFGNVRPRLPPRHSRT